MPLDRRLRTGTGKHVFGSRQERKLPTDVELPVYIKEQGKFADFYRAMFRAQTDKECGRAVFLEYAWDMNWCDPCAADPLTNRELRELGVFWVDAKGPPGKTAQPLSRRRPWTADVYITRLHLSYDRARFPEDLRFQVTGNRENFQGRYIVRHPWKGSPNACDAALFR